MDAHLQSREARLEKALEEANRQLLERDEGVLEILAVRERELARAEERLVREVEWRDREIEALNRAIAEMQASRVWRLAERYRGLRGAFIERVSTRTR